MLQKIWALDWISVILVMGITVTLLLPLFWGGNRYAWNNAVVIALFVVVGTLPGPVSPLTPCIVWCSHHRLHGLGNLHLPTNFNHSASSSCLPVQEQNNHRNGHLLGMHILMPQYPCLLFAGVLPNHLWWYHRAIRR